LPRSDGGADQVLRKSTRLQLAQNDQSVKNWHRLWLLRDQSEANSQGYVHTYSKGFKRHQQVKTASTTELTNQPTEKQF
jgi:hypothetical protein